MIFDLIQAAHAQIAASNGFPQSGRKPDDREVERAAGLFQSSQHVEHEGSGSDHRLTPPDGRRGLYSWRGRLACQGPEPSEGRTALDGGRPAASTKRKGARKSAAPYGLAI